MLGVFAVETNLRRERQLEGIAKAKAAGVYKGRPPSIEASRVRELKGRGVRPVDIAKVSRVTNASPSPREGRLLAQSVSRAALQQAIIKRQGLIAEQGYEQQAQSYLNMSAAADMAASAGELRASSLLRVWRVCSPAAREVRHRPYGLFASPPALLAAARAVL
jgi:hypothetical protein